MSDNKDFNLENEQENEAVRKDFSEENTASEIQETAEAAHGAEEENAENKDGNAAKMPKEPKPKKNIKIPLGAFLLSSVAIALAAVMLTYTVFSEFQKKNYGEAFDEGYLEGSKEENGLSAKDSIDNLLEQYFFNDKIAFDEATKELLTENALKQYVASIGDPHARYYTFEEYLELIDGKEGNSSGIGINVVSDTVAKDGKQYTAALVTNVAYDSPAESAGIKAGDLIVYIGKGESKKSFDELGGYEKSIDMLAGEINTDAELVTWRKNADGSFTETELTVTRQKITTSSVHNPHAASFDSKVGIIKIASFNYTTPNQFKRAVEDLKTAGCEKFVIDLRGNSGGDLVSIKAVLSLFLNEGDVYIRTKGKDGQIVSDVIVPDEENSGTPEGCIIKKEEIGKYKDLNIVILCNEDTASAAELFTATVRDYNLGKIIGMKTYGKGSMQSTFRVNGGGAVKFTTKVYFSAVSDSYEGIGIIPDVPIDLSDEAKSKFPYKLSDSEDNQLLEAVKHFK